ncbi:hypothetical protein Vadar_032644 [Vaccinium darrowii]|uniref:Uncharacterized protein n=1 Tax=Vaccinium darrowii TaxID=229202 RepID=A0ACB7Z084_9ERIC|nr:hypothetical protein Vadar_032644 [Vaccinium darrowii]
MKHLLATLAMNFKLLKVLDLQGAPLDQLHEEVGNLLHLRYLSVKRTKVKIVPKSIGNLHNLQTLNLKHSLVSVLQIGILSRLHKLRHLIALSRDNIQRGVEIHGGIGHLEELQTLRDVAANDYEEGVNLVTIKELENLRQLRNLVIVNIKRENGKALCTAIKKMKHLETLMVRAMISDEILNLHSLSSPPESLQRLYLLGRLETLPNWISKLNNLTALSLRWSGLTGTRAIKALQAMPNLIELYVYDGYDGEQLSFDVRGFQKLEMLSLRSLKVLNSFIIEEGGLPMLSWLRIGACPQLKEVPSDIRNLRKLKSFLIMDMPTEFLARMTPDKGQDYWVVEHIPKVRILWTDGTNGHKMYTPQEFQDATEHRRVNDESE